MTGAERDSRRALLLASLGGLAHAVGFLLWASDSGVYVDTESAIGTAFGLGYAGLGLFLLAALPLYLLGRYSVVSPTAMAIWILATTVQQHWVGSHPHPLSSYVIVWPIVLGFGLLVGAGEVGVRALLDRFAGVLGFRRLV